MTSVLAGLKLAFQNPDTEAQSGIDKDRGQQMGIAAYIKEIGRGHEGARSLDTERAQDLMAQVLDGKVTDLEIGAFALAMRIKGETLDELVGFAQAVHARTLEIRSDRPVVVIPSYNGARKLPNLTPLLAMRLAQATRR